MVERIQWRVNATGTAGGPDVTAIRQDTFRGREYTVVPVVGLVEGIIQGLNASEPEFAPAEEFGKFPAGWNGRPVTMNHPRVSGTLVSANDPAVLEEFAFGFLANTELDDVRLKFEAWLDNEIIAAKGGEFQDVIDRLNSGEGLVEVSTGLFCEVIDRTGTYDGVRYSAYWTNVVPDHLAFLPEGVIGACSVEAGCGAPRLNQAGQSGSVIVLAAPARIGASPTHCCDSCSSGGSCMPAANEQPATEGQAPATTTEEPTTPPVTETPTEPATSESTTPEGTEPIAEVVEPAPEQVERELAANAQAAHVLQRLSANAIPSGMTFENIQRIILDGLKEAYPECIYIAAITADMVAFEMRHDDGCGCGCCYSYCDSRYRTMGVAYSLSAEGGITFTGEPVPVNLIVQIVPKPNDVTADSSIAANEGASGANHEQRGADMPAETEQTTTTTADGQGGNNGAEGSPPVTANASVDDYLNGAPPALREVLQSGLQLHEARKSALVSKLAAHSSKAFTEEELKTQSLPELERLAVLAGITVEEQPVSFQGRAFPSGAGGEGISTNSTRNNEAPPPAPRAFETAPRGSGRTVADAEGQSDSQRQAAA